MSLKYEVVYDTEAQYIDYRRYGEEHRLYGPASVLVDKDMFWMQYGEMHRLDGPASVPAGRYYIRGEGYTEKRYDTKIRNITHTRE